MSLIGVSASVSSYLTIIEGEAYFLGLKVVKVEGPFPVASFKIVCLREKGKTLEVMKRLNIVKEMLDEHFLSFSLETSKSYITFRQSPTALAFMKDAYDQVLSDEKVVEIFSSLGD